jgi:hypothetical protein
MLQNAAMSPSSQAAERLATMACAGFELGGDAAEVEADVEAMWRYLGMPDGAFEAAAVAVGGLPQRPEIPVSEIPRRRAFERMVGINSVEVELTAALAARELLQRMARTCGAR